MKKTSLYNHFIDNGSHTFLYNVATDQVLALNSSLVELIQKHQTNIDELKTIHPSLFEALSQKGMIIDDTVNEVEAIIEQWNKKESDPSHFTITILPTLDCNLRCWYCYEEHKKGSVMKDAIKDRVFLLIENLTQRDNFEHLHLDFFGGEPLLSFTNIILPILKYAREKCTAHQVKLSLHITTNGVLLTEKIIDQLKQIEFDYIPSFQITLDGNREKHNATRYTCKGQPTFDLILQNIRRVLKASMIVNNRFNYTQENVETLVDIIDEYKDLPEEEKKYLSFDFQQVWQESNQTSNRKKALSIKEKFKKENLNINIDNQYNKDRCYAEYENKVVINYNGDLYKCTARDFVPDLREGTLNEDGTLTWNTRYAKRMSLKNGNKTCRACSIFPICHGRCSQAKLEKSDINTCIANRNEEEKKELVKERLHYLLTESNKYNQ